MKKLVVFLMVMSFSAPAFADPILDAKRQNMATRAMYAAAKLQDAYYELKAIKTERSFLGADFQNTDFSSTNLQHIDAGMMGTFLDFVVGSLDTWYEDAGNSGRNKQILNQLRG